MNQDKPDAAGATSWTALRIHPNDNVATVLRDLPAGSQPRLAGCDAPVLVEDLSRGHKFALSPIAAGDHVTKFGQAIGVAVEDIAAGKHVHLHNLEGFAGQAERHRRET